MNRSDLLLVSLGGAGNRLADTILNADSRFQGLFINTSITDLESLDNFNPLIKNYICISQQNGVGRNREIGRGYAEQYVMTIIETLTKYQQDTIYLISSLGGGSGSSILTTLLESLGQLKEEGMFTKTINLIAIIPDIKSPSIILENSLDTWSEINKHSKHLNSMMFIDNGTSYKETLSQNEKEIKINSDFTKIFDSIFDIPDCNGINFDNGNLGNILRDKGCLYIYDLPSGCTTVNAAMRKAEQSSVLANIYKNSKNIIQDEEGNKLMKCGYIGVSLNDPNYTSVEITNDYLCKQEPYIGKNEEKNLVLISGCLPPSDTMEVIELELNEREKNETTEDNDIFFKDFSRKNKKKESVIINSNATPEENTVAATNTNTNKSLKKVMKKNLFKR